MLARCRTQPIISWRGVRIIGLAAATLALPPKPGRPATVLKRTRCVPHSALVRVRLDDGYYTRCLCNQECICNVYIRQIGRYCFVTGETCNGYTEVSRVTDASDPPAWAEEVKSTLQTAINRGLVAKTTLFDGDWDAKLLLAILQANLQANMRTKTTRRMTRRRRSGQLCVVERCRAHQLSSDTIVLKKVERYRCGRDPLDRRFGWLREDLRRLDRRPRLLYLRREEGIPVSVTGCDKKYRHVSIGHHRGRRRKRENNPLHTFVLFEGDECIVSGL